MDPKTSDIHKAAGIIIQDRKLLVERSKGKEHFKAPGGKIEPGENAKQALIRELSEEFQIQVNENDLEDFGVFCHPAAGQEEKSLCMNIFVVKKWEGEITPDHEVEQILWLTSQFPAGIKVGSIFEHEVIPRLKAKNLID